MTDIWFSYGSIRYSPDQLLFLLEHRALLESGRWPSEHIESGYTGSSKGRAYKSEGYFVKPVIIIAELNARLTSCCLDGELVVGRYTNGYDEVELARIHHLDYFDVVKRIGTALAYCQGAKRKRSSYQDYKKNRMSYQRKREPHHQA